MIDPKFASGLTLLTTAELAGVCGGALPACFALPPVMPGGTVDSLQNAWAYASRASVRRSN